MNNLTEQEKFKVWIDYMLTIVKLNNHLHEFPIDAKGVSENVTKYPLFGIKTVKILSKHKIKTFEEFCNGADSRVSESLVGWYWRFKDRIFNNK